MALIAPHLERARRALRIPCGEIERQQKSARSILGLTLPALQRRTPRAGVDSVWTYYVGDRGADHAGHIFSAALADPRKSPMAGSHPWRAGRPSECPVNIDPYPAGDIWDARLCSPDR
jgi:hypothetical protein